MNFQENIYYGSVSFCKFTAKKLAFLPFFFQNFKFNKNNFVEQLWAAATEYSAIVTNCISFYNELNSFFPNNFLVDLVACRYWDSTKNNHKCDINTSLHYICCRLLFVLVFANLPFTIAVFRDVLKIHWLNWSNSFWQTSRKPW